MSGYALSRNQRLPSALIAAVDWVRDKARWGSLRAVVQTGHQQFHCGSPPPAAVPRRMRRNRKAEGLAFASP
jgi:hypothetical protein